MHTEANFNHLQTNQYTLIGIEPYNEVADLLDVFAL